MLPGSQGPRLQFQKAGPWHVCPGQAVSTSQDTELCPIGPAALSGPPDTLWDTTSKLDRVVAEVDLVLQTQLLMNLRGFLVPSPYADLTELAQSCSACDLALVQQAEVKCSAV